MNNSTETKIGIVGACGRGKSFKAACDAVAGVHLHAVCDINEKGLAEAAERLGAAEKYVNYETMLKQSGVQAVILGTPMPLHVPQAILALKRNIHVLSEVPAAVSLEESRELVRACRKSKPYT